MPNHRLDLFRIKRYVCEIRTAVKRADADRLTGRGKGKHVQLAFAESIVAEGYDG